MQVHLSLPEEPILAGCALTVGTFDGVHRGHRTLVARLKEEAKLRQVPAAALTFTDMPLCFLKPDECPGLLTLPEEKIAAFAETALDHLFIVPFDAAIARQTAREFMEFWHRHIGLKLFMGGPDFAMGRNREGNIPALRAIGAELGFEVLTLESKLLAKGLPISSTRCRQTVEAGDVDHVRDFMGRPYVLQGRVVRGQQLGRTIGVPTINMKVPGRKVLPGHGVYAVRAWWVGLEQPVPAVLNVGLRPTVDGKRLAIEFHVIDRDVLATPEYVHVEFVLRLREERKFEGLEALKAQIAKDIGVAKRVLMV